MTKSTAGRGREQAQRWVEPLSRFVHASLADANDPASLPFGPCIPDAHAVDPLC